MTSLNKLQEIIRGRTVAICSHGRSIEGLESMITELKDKDICWMSLGLFTTIEKYILSKINKKLDIVFDCATVPHARLDHYERIRLPRIHEFLNRPDKNLVFVSHGLVRDSILPFMPILINEWYKDKIIEVDCLFPPDEIPFWMSVPNSLTLAVSVAVAGGAKQIITFGLDGYDGDISKGLDSYYHPEAHEKERQAALGHTHDSGINRDTRGFKEKFEKRFKEYQILFNNNSTIYNCSPSSIYEFPPKIHYSNLKEILQ